MQTEDKAKTEELLQFPFPVTEFPPFPVRY